LVIKLDEIFILKHEHINWYLNQTKPESPVIPYRKKDKRLHGVVIQNKTLPALKGHDNETDFLVRLVCHRSLTLPLNPFLFWFLGDNRYHKLTSRYQWYQRW
jgi:hypothetical protein